MAAGRCRDRPTSRPESSLAIRRVNDPISEPAAPRRLVILAEGKFGFHHGKTAVGVIRYGPDDVVAVIDSTQAGGNVATYPARPSTSRSWRRSTRRSRAEPRPDTLLIGIAPTGGKLPDELAGDDPRRDRGRPRRPLRAAHVPRRRPRVRRGRRGGRDAGSSTTAGRRTAMETAVGRRHGAGKRVILTVGTDCAIGKMSVALELRAAARAAGAPRRSCRPARPG